MGRRSINTTKSGKYMNPTDQASEFFTCFIIIHLFFINEYIIMFCIFEMQEKKHGKKS